MNKQIITFDANEQSLVKTGGLDKYSSNKVSYIEAHFNLGENWSGYDSIRAVWSTWYSCISTVLDPSGVCIVPHEVLTRTEKVMVNLVGSISEDDVLTDRLTTYPVLALTVDADAKVCGTETAEVTPSQFEQFVSIVQDAVANIKDIVSTTLNADYTLTFVYSDGTSYTTPSIRGERGPQGADGSDGTDGNGIASAVLNSNYTLTLTFTDGTSYTTPSIRGAQGPKGDTGEVSLADLSTLLPTDTASGSIASFPDGQSVIPAVSVVADIEPLQSGSGTPSPTNIRPISGHTECVTSRCGVNVWDEEWEVGEYDNNGQKVSGSGVRCKNYIAILPSANYYLLSPNLLYVCFYDADKNFISRNTYGGNTVRTTPNNAYYMTFNTASAYGTTYNHDISINYPSTDTSYHAYDGNTYTTDLGRTVYGGTLDVVSGELVVDRAMVDLGTLNWSAGYGGFIATPSGMKTTTSNSTPFGALCDRYATVSYTASTDKSISGLNNTNYVLAKDSDYSSSSAFTSAMSGVQLVYELATPQTYQLTPTEVDLLLGQNNVWTDCGSVEVTYKADIQRYIDKKLG